MVLCNRVI